MSEPCKAKGPWIWWMSEKPPFDIGKEPESHIIVFSVQTAQEAEEACKMLNELEEKTALVNKQREAWEDKMREALHNAPYIDDGDDSY